MPDVSLYVALITAAAGVGGAAVPVIAVIIRDVRQAERDRHERYAGAMRQVCLDLLRAAGELQARVANAAEYHGEEMGARLAEIRESAAAVRLNAASVALLAPAKLAGPAERLAQAANLLAVAAAANTDAHLGVMVDTPSYTGLDESVAAFRQIAVAVAAGIASDDHPGSQGESA